MKLFISYIMCFIIILACSENSTEPIDLKFKLKGNLLYYNSFEDQLDSLNWTGISAGNIVADAPAGGETKSLQIGGGCVQPTAALNLGKAYKSGKIKISSFAKVLQENQSGHIDLGLIENGSFTSGIILEFNTTEWNYYSSAKELNVVSGDSLRAEFYVGGFVPAEIRIDNLTIEYADD